MAKVVKRKQKHYLSKFQLVSIPVIAFVYQAKARGLAVDRLAISCPSECQRAPDFTRTAKTCTVKFLFHLRTRPWAVSFSATLDGRVKFKVPVGTQSGKLFRVRASGVKPVRGGTQGDLLCRVSVETPINLTAKQRELLEELHDTLNHKTHAPKREGWFDSVRSFFDEMKF